MGGAAGSSGGGGGKEEEREAEGRQGRGREEEKAEGRVEEVEDGSHALCLLRRIGRTGVLRLLRLPLRGRRYAGPLLRAQLHMVQQPGTPVIVNGFTPGAAYKDKVAGLQGTARDGGSTWGRLQVLRPRTTSASTLHAPPTDGRAASTLHAPPTDGRGAATAHGRGGMLPGGMLGGSPIASSMTTKRAKKPWSNRLSGVLGGSPIASARTTKQGRQGSEMAQIQTELHVLVQQLKERPKDVFAYEEHWGLTTRHRFVTPRAQGYTWRRRLETGHVAAGPRRRAGRDPAAGGHARRRGAPPRSEAACGRHAGLRGDAAVERAMGPGQEAHELGPYAAGRSLGKNRLEP